MVWYNSYFHYHSFKREKEKVRFVFFITTTRELILYYQAKKIMREACLVRYFLPEIPCEVRFVFFCVFQRNIQREAGFVFFCVFNPNILCEVRFVFFCVFHPNILCEVRFVFFCVFHPNIQREAGFVFFCVFICAFVFLFF